MNPMRLATCLLSGLLLAAIPAAQQSLNTELVVNGDFEDISLTGWNITRGSWTPATYSGGAFPSRATGQAINGGRFMLRALTWGSSEWALMNQEWDLTGNAAEIDRGELQIDASMYQGGWGNDADYPYVWFFFYDENGQILDTWEWGTSRDLRNRETTMMYRGGSRPVPVLARRLLMQLGVQRDSGNSMEGYIDNASLMLRRSDFRPSAQPVGVELLDNTDFERRTIVDPASPQPWLTTRGLFRPFDYGDANVPGPDIAARTGGGARAIQATTWGSSYWAYLDQYIDLRGNGPEIEQGNMFVEFGADFGGQTSATDYSQIWVYQYDSSGTLISESSIGGVTRDTRNYRTTMLRYARTVEIEREARRLLFRIGAQCADRVLPITAYLDNPTLMLRRGPIQSPPRPMNTNLLSDSTFEDSLVLDPGLLANERWFVNRGLFETTEYDQSGVPAQTVSDAFGGGSRFLRPTTWGSGYWAYLQQNVDVSGNAAEIDQNQLFAHCEYYVGGRTTDADYARVELQFRDASGAAIGSNSIGGSSSWTTRNGETQMKRRQFSVPIPPDTRTVSCYLAFQDADRTAPFDAFIDNVTLEISQDERAPAPLPLDTELLENPTFEGPRITTPRGPYGYGWYNVDSPFRQVDYGTAGFPSIPFGESIQGGRSMVRATSWRGGNVSGLRQNFDVRGNAAEIDAGLLAIRLSGLFGGLGSDTDYCRLRAFCYNAKGQTLQGGSFLVGDVGRGDRNSQSILLPREGVFRIPALTRSILVELEMVRAAGNSIDAIADNLSAMLTRGQICGSAQCITLSSSSPALAKQVTGPLADQLTELNGGPPAFDPAEWSAVYRKNENDNPALNRSFLCTDPTIIPLNEAFVDAAAYLREADEVTLDNCSSAFYRFTFNMPATFQNATLYGVLNADDQARIFLNGNPITGEMLANSFGSDALDANGKRVMTWPTQDMFFTNDVSLFRGGTNELVFAVCSDASQFEPAGLEFEARVQADTFAALTLDDELLSVTTGGVRNFFIDAGPGNGGRAYTIVGSFQGMWPGQTISGYQVPLNRDFYFDFLLGNPNGFILGSSGSLSTSGQAFARLTLSPLPPSLVGLEISHAAVVGALTDPDFLMSNPTLLTLTQ